MGTGRADSIASWRFGRCGVLAATLLCANVAFAQSSTPSQPSAQDKSSTPSQSNSSNKPVDQSSSDGDKNPVEPGMSRIKITVTGNTDKPVPNASVYVRFNESGGFMHKEKLSEMNFKTNEDGSVKVPSVPQGKVLIQVVAKGWHTYGKWYDIEKDEESVEIKLEPPPHWY